MRLWQHGRCGRCALDFIVAVVRVVLPLAAAEQRGAERRWDPPPRKWVDGERAERWLCALSDEHLRNIKRYLRRTVAELSDAYYEDDWARERVDKRQRKVAEVEHELWARSRLGRHQWTLAAIALRGDCPGLTDSIADDLAAGQLIDRWAKHLGYDRHWKEIT